MNDKKIKDLISKIDLTCEHYDYVKSYPTYKAIEALADPTASDAVDILIKVMEQCDKVLVLMAAYALGEIGDKRAIEPLKKALEDDEYGVFYETGLGIDEMMEEMDEYKLAEYYKHVDLLLVSDPRSPIEIAIEKIEAKL